MPTLHVRPDALTLAAVHVRASAVRLDDESARAAALIGACLDGLGDSAGPAARSTWQAAAAGVGLLVDGLGALADAFDRTAGAYVAVDGGPS